MEPRPSHQFDPFSPEAAAYDQPNVDLDGIDWNDPESFFRAIGGGSGTSLPIPTIMSPKAVRREATERSTKLFASYETLGQILRRHEATIQKRWAKRTRAQRVKVLLEAWPNMPVIHRPDFDAFKRETEAQRDAGTKYRDHYIWPHINQTDLSSPRSLLLLLNARGRHPPSDFAAADNDVMHLGRVSKALVPIFLNEFIMILNGATTAAEYGKLMAWDDHPDAFEWMTTRKQFLPGEGLLILESQQRLLSFLVECCHRLLPDIPAETLTAETFPIQPEPTLKSEAESNGFESLAIMAAEGPYRVPAKLDLGRVESLLAAKASAAEDHLWSLREDPAYFAEHVVEAKEHRQEMLKDIHGNIHPSLRKGRDTIFWARTIGNVLAEAYLELEYFSDLRKQASKLKLLQCKYEDVISPTKDLPEEYLAAILRFRYYVSQTAKGPLNQLKQIVTASPPMRKFYVRQPPVDDNSSKMVIMSKSGTKMSKTEASLTWLLRTLWEDGHSLFLARLPLVVDELERLIQSEPEADILISGYVSSVIGDLSIISQCSRQLEIYQPWAQTFETAFSERKDEIRKEFAEKTKPWARILQAIHEQRLIGAAKLGEPSPGRFTYPVGKRRTKENVEALQRAERELDVFWAAIDRVMHVHAGDLDGTAVRQLLLQPRILQRTPDWVEPAAEKGKHISKSIDHTIDMPLSSLYFDLLDSSGSQGVKGSTVASTTAKPKIKTKGTPRSLPSKASAVDSQQRADADPQPTFPVDARALKVFRTLFFNPSVTSSPGEVSWNDFLHAMAAVGFAAEKLYGSVWQFRPTMLDVEAGIQFHEPHPRGKIPFWVARRHGRRLGRAYGWFGEMFVLKK